MHYLLHYGIPCSRHRIHIGLDIKYTVTYAHAVPYTKSVAPEVSGHHSEDIVQAHVPESILTLTLENALLIAFPSFYKAEGYHHP